MGISGNLRTMSPGDLLQWLNFAQKTGTLVLTAGGVQKKVFFREGRVISSASTDPREYLGQFLMSHGYISEEQLTKAMQEQARTRRLLGRILVDLGVVPEKDLGRLMLENAEESIYEIFLWKEAEFHFMTTNCRAWNWSRCRSTSPGSSWKGRDASTSGTASPS